MPVQTFTTLNDPLTTNHFTTATAINGSGDVVGFYEASGAAHGFLLSGGTYTTLDDPLGTHGTSAGGINDVGQIVGGYQDSASQTHGFLLSGGTYTTLDDPVTGAHNTVAVGINIESEIVGSAGAFSTAFC